MNETIHILSKFRYVDKYQTFHEILPFVLHTSEEQKAIVNGILDDCAGVLLRLFNEPKKPTKPVLRQSLIECMDALAIARINAENREFGYQLGWYLAEKVNVNLKKGTEKKIWGYWQVEGNEVKLPVKPRISKKAKEQTKNEHKQRSANQEAQSQEVLT